MLKEKTQVVMMAAGFGSRVGEITQYIPKSLIPINGKPIIEHNIDLMISAGIDRLIMTVGYKKEVFAYLVEKYRGRIEIIQVDNPYYQEFNTLSSVLVASEYLDRDTFLVTSDIYPTINVYEKYGWSETEDKSYSFYLHRWDKNLDRPEWIALLSEDEMGQYIISVDKSGFEGSTWSGISFWKKEDLPFIKKLLNLQDMNSPATKKLYWDEIFFPYYNEWHVHVRHLESNGEIFEVDNETDLQVLKETMHDSQSIEALKATLRMKQQRGN